ncbi:hypothetical protein [Streptomyces sp. NPDC058579]|uniref:hypothetical protein n=1 Tax=Streptomyces sp. NPDC058579 TaxID=3346548 RepID=UPI0036499FB9
MSGMGYGYQCRSRSTGRRARRPPEGVTQVLTRARAVGRRVGVGGVDVARVDAGRVDDGRVDDDGRVELGRVPALGPQASGVAGC